MDYQGLYESTAKAELGVAQRMVGQGDYWTAVYHCQQAAEKMAKAVLSKLGVVEAKEHVVSDLFASRILRHRRDPDLQKAYRYLLKLDEHR